ncbi:MAG: hypothetical protein P1P78_11400 [Methyloprofundus sp.]|nr:hypothetical protein [Methyloprofundus sp.]
MNFKYHPQILLVAGFLTAFYLSGAGLSLATLLACLVAMPCLALALFLPYLVGVSLLAALLSLPQAIRSIRQRQDQAIH